MLTVCKSVIIRDIVHRFWIYITAIVIVAVFYLNHYTTFGEYLWELIDSLLWLTVFLIGTVCYYQNAHKLNSFENVILKMLLGGIFTQALLNVAYGVHVFFFRMAVIRELTPCAETEWYRMHDYQFYSGINWLFITVAWLLITIVIFTFINTKNLKE